MQCRNEERRGSLNSLHCKQSKYARCAYRCLSLRESTSSFAEQKATLVAATGCAVFFALLRCQHGVISMFTDDSCTWTVSITDGRTDVIDVSRERRGAVQSRSVAHRARPLAPLRFEQEYSLRPAPERSSSARRGPAPRRAACSSGPWLRRRPTCLSHREE